MHSLRQEERVRVLPDFSEHRGEHQLGFLERIQQDDGANRGQAKKPTVIVIIL